MNNNICKCQEKQQQRREKLDHTYMCGSFAGSRHALMVQFVRSELVPDTCSSNRVGPRPQPFRSTALDFDCDSQFKSDTDCTRTNDAALFAYAVVNGTRHETVQKGLTLAGVVSCLALNEVKYVRTVTVTTIYACYKTIDLSRRHCHPFRFFKGLAQLALCHVLDQKLYDIGWFSHRIRSEGETSLAVDAH